MEYSKKVISFWVLLISVCYGQIVVNGLTPTRFSRVSAEKVLDDIYESIETITTDIDNDDESKPFNVECGGKYSQNEGVIWSPGYPVRNYTSDSNCTWSIEVEEGKILRMEFAYMDIEFGPPDCPFDGVIVVDNSGMTPVSFTPGSNPFGASWNQPSPHVIGKFCGQEKFKPFVSVTNSVQIGFYSDASTHMSGFMLSWKSVIAGASVLQSCNFEEGLCEGWKNIETEEDVFDWKLMSGPTPSSDTGPMFDHTKNDSDGTYAYIEASAPRVTNDTAVLALPELSFREGDSAYCLDFWYNMHGDKMGSLIVGLAVGNTRLIEWMENGNKGVTWKHASIPIERISGKFKIMLAGVIGAGYTGDIAIDDIKVYAEPCSEINWKDRLLQKKEIDIYNTPCSNEDDYPCMNSTTCIPDDKLCDGLADCPLMDDEAQFLCDGSTVPPPPIGTADSTTDSDVDTAEDVTDDFTTSYLDVTASILDTTAADVGKLVEEAAKPSSWDTMHTETTSKMALSPTTASSELTSFEDDLTTMDGFIATTDDIPQVTTDVEETTNGIIEVTTTQTQRSATSPDIRDATPSVTTARRTTKPLSTTMPKIQISTQRDIATQPREQPSDKTSSNPSGNVDITTEYNSDVISTELDSTTKVAVTTGNILATAVQTRKVTSYTKESDSTPIKPLNDLVLMSTSSPLATTTTTSIFKESDRSQLNVSKETIPVMKATEFTPSVADTATERHLPGNMEGPTAAEKQQGVTGSSMTSTTSLFVTGISVIFSIAYNMF